MPRPTRLAAQKGAGSVSGFPRVRGLLGLAGRRMSPILSPGYAGLSGREHLQGGDALPAGTATDPQTHTGCSFRLGSLCCQGVQLSWAARICPRFHLEAQENKLLVTPSLRCGVRLPRGLFSF